MIRANGNRQDIGNATNVGKSFKANAGWESKNNGVLLTIVIGKSAQGLELVPQHG